MCCHIYNVICRHTNIVIRKCPRKARQEKVLSIIDCFFADNVSLLGNKTKRVLKENTTTTMVNMSVKGYPGISTVQNLNYAASTMLSIVLISSLLLLSININLTHHIEHTLLLKLVDQTSGITLFIFPAIFYVVSIFLNHHHMGFTTIWDSLPYGIHELSQHRSAPAVAQLSSAQPSPYMGIVFFSFSALR